MELATLFDDYPVLASIGHNKSRQNRPLMLSVLDHLENQLDQGVGHVFRRLPAILMELENDYEATGNGRKRKLLRPSANYEPKSKVLVTTKDDKFQVKLDTSIYQPDEITVKVVNDQLSISARHETKSDDVYEFHEMHRSFGLPEGVDPQNVISKLSPEGQLTIEAPLPPKEKEAVTERLVPVQVSDESNKTPEKSSITCSSKETPTKNCENK